MSLKEKKKGSFYEDVKDCIWFNSNKKNYRCELGIVEDFETHKRYNCVKYGRCVPYEPIKKLKEVSSKEAKR